MNLANVKHLSQFRRLPIPKNEMLIVGSATMALFGLRENKDIDIWATPRIMEVIKKNKNFHEKKSDIDGSIIYESNDGVFEFCESFTYANGTFKECMKRAVTLYGIHFQSPEDVLEWKLKANRPKDQEDITILENFLNDNLVDNYLRSLHRLNS